MIQEVAVLSTSGGTTAVIEKVSTGYTQHNGSFHLISSLFKTVSETFKFWAKRSRERAELAMMSDYHLDDIGITRIEAQREANKWFWQA
ncbi:MAG: DUF1127 domain-containing protein [SAR324 cluster bacterium]|nr:DUF1127 domain-containing protein [SAR324 cluster bacterium]